MILVSVRFAEINQRYDFKLDETVDIRQITAEMVEMISQKEHIPVSKNPGLFLLCNEKTKQIFSPVTTLAENGVGSGDTLLLV